MNPFTPVIWDKNHTFAVLAFTVLFFAVFIFLFSNSMVNPVWVPISVGIVAWYFITLNMYSVRWQQYDTPTFTKKLFWHSLGYRVVFGLIVIFVSELTWQQPFYVGAADAIAYHDIGVIMSEHYTNFDFDRIARFIESEAIDNTGPSLMLGVLYSFTFGSYLSGVLLYTVMGAFTVLYVYKTAQIIWGESIARLSGLLLMHFPLALFYSSVTMKEGVVTFLMVMIVYIMTRSINGLHVKPLQWVMLVLFLAALFFFRTPVGLGCVVLTATAFLLFRYRGSYAASLLIGIVSVSSFFIIMYYIGEIQYFVDRAASAETIGQQRTALIMGDGRAQIVGVSILDLALAPIYLVAAFFAPFPAFVEVGTVFGTPFDQNHYNAPGRMVWNILAYFSFIGLYYTVKDKLFESFVVWGFSLGYIYILISTVTFTRERFAYIGMPLLLIFASVGIYKTKSRLLWYIYLAGLIVLILAWNVIRLGTRGL